MPIPAAAERLTPVRWALARIDEVLFTRGSAGTLGWLRLLFYGGIFLMSFDYQGDFPLWALVSRDFWEPIGLYRLLPIPVLSTAGLAAVLWTWRGAMVFSAIGLGGWLPRVLTAVLGFYVLGLPQNFGKVDHGYTAVMIGLVIFAVARANSGWSLDNLLHAARGRPAAPPALTAETTWPVTMMRLILVLILWSAAIAKLRDAGPIAWVLSDNISNTFIRHYYTHHPSTDIGLVLAQFPLVCHLLGAGALTIEFISPALVVLRGRWRFALLLGVVAMLLGFGFTLGILFQDLLLLLVFFFLPWREIGAFLVRVWRRPAFVVVFDGSCGLCRRTVAVLRRVDVLGRLEIRDALGEWDILQRRFPDLSQDACLMEMHVIRHDRQIAVGFAGYRAMAGALPVAWIVLPLLYLPGSKWIGDWIYRHVASHRHHGARPLPAAGAE